MFFLLLFDSSLLEIGRNDRPIKLLLTLRFYATGNMLVTVDADLPAFR